MIFAILFFIAYSVVTFIAPNWIWLACFSGFNLILCFAVRTGWAKTFKNLFKILIMAGLVFALNLIFDDVFTCLITAWKLVIVANFTFVFSKAFSPSQLASGFSQLLFPLKLFKVDTGALSLVIVIALEFIPILSKSAKSLQKCLKARGFKLGLKNVFTQGHVVFSLYFSEIFKRVDALELAFKARGYTADAEKINN